MNNDEKKFEDYVNGIRFDDAPDTGHRDKLEKRLLDAYDTEQKYGGYEEPVAVYFRKLAIAAGFLLAAGVLFWAIDSTCIRRDPLAGHPDRKTIDKIIAAENVTGAEKKKLLAQIHDVWALVDNQDADKLVSVLTASDTAYAVRKWAAGCLGKFGTEKTLTVIENTIETMEITDPQDPLMIAAEKIRQRLGLSGSPENGPNDLPQFKSSGCCRPESD